MSELTLMLQMSELTLMLLTLGEKKASETEAFEGGGLISCALEQLWRLRR